MSSESKLVFQTLNKINVSKHVEKRNGLSYLSWSHAWETLCKSYPESEYEIRVFTNEKTGVTLPYLYDENLGYMVFTSITIHGVTREMWMAVMDGANNPLKAKSWTYKVKEWVDRKWTGNYIEKSVQPINMFDVNKAIMRCLTKNIAMFGLALNIYSGEDFPEEEPKPTAPKKAAPLKKITVEQFVKATEGTLAQMKTVLAKYALNADQTKLIKSLILEKSKEK